jgi:hypothetical protein
MVEAYILRLRGEPALAADLFSEALKTTEPAGFPSWTLVVRGYLLSLAECGRIDECRERGAVLLSEAKAAELTVMIAYVLHGMAAVEIAAGDYLKALTYLQSIDQIRQQWPLGAVFGGACQELYARVAIAGRNQNEFERAVAQCRQVFTRTGNPVLVARYQRLIQDGERAHLRVVSMVSQAPPSSSEAEGVTQDASVAIESASILVPYQNFEERAAKVLSFAIEASSTQYGMLYLIRDRTPTLAAVQGICPDITRMNSLVAEYIHAEVDPSSDLAFDPDDIVTSTVDTGDWLGPTGTQFAPALLSHIANGGLAVTGVLVFDVEGQRRPPDDLLSRLSEALTISKDVVPWVVQLRPRQLYARAS